MMNWVRKYWTFKMYIHRFCRLNTSVQLQFSENLKFTLDQSEPVWFEAWRRSGWSLLSCSNPPSSRNGMQGCFSPYHAVIYPAAITWEIRSHRSAERLNCSNPPCPPWLHLWRSLTWCRWAPASQWEEWAKGEAPAEWGWGWGWGWLWMVGWWQQIDSWLARFSQIQPETGHGDTEFVCAQSLQECRAASLDSYLPANNVAVVNQSSCCSSPQTPNAWFLWDGLTASLY